MISACGHKDTANVMYLIEEHIIHIYQFHTKRNSDWLLNHLMVTLIENLATLSHNVGLLKAHFVLREHTHIFKAGDQTQQSNPTIAMIKNQNNCECISSFV